MSNVRCSSCQVEFPSSQLECHISTDHLDYYPYGCGHCGHWLPTEDLAHFHAAKKQHLPIKIHEKPDIAKEHRLRQIIDSSNAGAVLPAENNDFGAFGNFPWQQQFDGNSNSASPASVNAAGSAQNQSPAAAAAEAPVAMEDLQGTTSASTSSDIVEQKPVFTETLVDMEAFELNDSPRSCRSYANSENSYDRDDKPVNIQIPIKDVAANPALFQKSINARAKKKTKLSGPQDKKSRKSQIFSMSMEETIADVSGGHELTEFAQNVSKQTKICNICQMKLHVSNIENHVNRHLATRPLAACSHCSYKGRSLNSVRVHITWKHPGKSTKTGIGAKDLSHLDATEETMFDRCFGEQEPQEMCADPVAVSKSIGMLRPFAKRAAKTIGTTGPDKMQLQSPPNMFMQPPNPVSTATGPLGQLVTRTSQSASGRQYKHMICQECGQECLDALASAHVYAAHINLKDMVQCPYCDYGVAYAISEAKRHISAKHPDKPVRVIDKRQEPEMQELYIHWRSRCFPEIGSRRSVGAGSQAPPTMVVSATRQEQADNADKLMKQLFGRKRPLNDLPPAAPAAPMDVDETRLMTPEALTQSAFSALGANKGPIDAAESAKCLNARMKQTCSICGAEITLLWLHRHVWKHLSDEYGINPFKCAVEGCEFSTYLRRSLDSHCSYHGAGYTTEHLGAIDERHKYSNQYMKCMIDCFGPDVPDAMFGDSYFCSPAIGVQNIVKAGQSSTMLTTKQNPIVSRMEQHVQIQPTDLSKPPRPEQVQPLHSNVLRPERTDQLNVMSQEQKNAFDRQSVITATPMDAWCQKCQCGFARDEADDHVWQAHLGGVQPFRCGRCLKSFLELTQMENHWTSEHSRCSQTGEMEVIEEPDAMYHFENMIIECFPDFAAHRSAIKIEVDADEIEH